MATNKDEGKIIMTATPAITPHIYHIMHLKAEIKRLTAELDEQMKVVTLDMQGIDKLVDSSGVKLAAWTRKEVEYFKLKDFKADHKDKWDYYKPYITISKQAYVVVG